MRATGRRSRIVATMGPACDSPEMIRGLIEAGVDVFRLNFSHGTQDEHGNRIKLVRAISAEIGRPIGLLQDLQGPKMRVGKLVNGGPVQLEPGAKIRLTTTEIVGTAERVSTTYEPLPDDVHPGEPILLDDGRLLLKVLKVEGREVLCEVVVGGALGEHKGINLPRTPLSAPCLTPKDIEDLQFGLAHGVDMVGLSFVRRPTDIEELRKHAASFGGNPLVVAKIERVEAIEHLEEIIEAADGVMVARGDLGVETSIADVPIFQKRILAAVGRLGKPDITATQMLESMISNPLPSRAEATDVANAVFDGTDALMLSAETAVGKYPVEAVRTMSEIASRAEEHLSEFGTNWRARPAAPVDIARSSAHAAFAAAEELKAAAIVVLTLSGRTAFLVASRRPSMPVYALTPTEETRRRLTLAWGVTSVLMPLARDAGEFNVLAERALDGHVKKGDVVVILSGSTTSPGKTNIMKIHRIGDL